MGIREDLVSLCWNSRDLQIRYTGAEKVVRDDLIKYVFVAVFLPFY